MLTWRNVPGRLLSKKVVCRNVGDVAPHVQKSIFTDGLYYRAFHWAQVGSGGGGEATSLL